jgi:hypothetical protein
MPDPTPAVLPDTRARLITVPENLVEELRKLYRGLEMSAGIMRDRSRTGGWSGAERTANAFARYAATAQSLHALLSAALTATPPASDAAVPAGVGVACRFLGAEYSHADLAIAQRAACAIVPYYGTGDHGEQEAARDGKLWNDHPAVQGALRGLYEARAMSVAQIASEDQAYDPAQIAFDQQCDDPAPGDWNDACIHISKELRELRPAAPKVASEAAMREADFYAGYLAACDVTEYDVDKAWSEYVAALHPTPGEVTDGGEVRS